MQGLRRSKERSWTGEEGELGKVIAQWAADGTLPDNFLFVPLGETDEEDEVLEKKGLGTREIEVYVKPRTFKKLEEEAAYLGCPVDAAVRKIVIDALNGNTLGLRQEASSIEFPYELYVKDGKGGNGPIYDGFDDGEYGEPLHDEIIQDDFADMLAWVEIPCRITQKVYVAVLRAAVAKKESRIEWVRRRLVSYLYSRYGNGEEGGDVGNRERFLLQLEIKEQKEKFDELEASIARL